MGWDEMGPDFLGMERDRISHRTNSHGMGPDIYLWDGMGPDLCGMGDPVPCQEMGRDRMGPELCGTGDPVPVPWPA